MFEQALEIDPSHTRARKLLEELPEDASVPPTEPPLGPPEPLPPPVVEDNPITEVDWGQEAGAAWSTGSKDLAPAARSAWDTKSNPGFHLRTSPALGPSEQTRDALDLVAEGTPAPWLIRKGAAERRQEELGTLLAGVKDLLELEDYGGAIDLLQRAQALDPGNREVAALRQKSERTLLSTLESKLGGLHRVPQVVLKEEEILWLNLDHRAAFLLAQIDGKVTYEDLFAVSGMSRLDTARILAQLADEGVIRPME